MQAPLKVERKEHEGLIYYRLTGSSFDQVQQKIEEIGERGFAQFSLPYKIGNEFKAYGSAKEAA